MIVYRALAEYLWESRFMKQFGTTALLEGVALGVLEPVLVLIRAHT